MARAPVNQNKKVSVLVVDDERGARMALEVPLRLSGYEVTAVADGRTAIALGQKTEFDVVLTDVFMPDIGGIEVVREFHRLSPNSKIIVMTAQGSLEIALQAIEEGAVDFIAKPFDIEQVLSLVHRAAKHHTIPPVENDDGFPQSGLIGHSPQMVRAYKLAAYAARTNTTVLIEGESGTGKELIARAIHVNSTRAAFPFTAINCSALTETLLESELFGYTKGSFTGATTDRAGLFESSDRGTILLDELATTSGSFQAGLLRVIQEKEVRRIGEHAPRKVDVRIIGATNTDLEILVDRGHFRADLFYRLSVLRIKLPPLRERDREDLELLTRHFLKKYNTQSGSPIHIADETLDLLSRYAWPGNVRELENAVEHAVATNSGEVITIHDLPQHIRERASVPGPTPESSRPVSIADDRPSLQELNRRYVQLILAEAGGNKSRAASLLGINRRTLYRYLDQESGELTDEDQECLDVPPTH